MTLDLSVFWVIALVLVLAWTLDRTLIKPLTRVMQDREQAIASARELAESATQRAATAAREFEEKRTEARADIFKQISYKKVDIEIARFLDFYIELGPKKWELVDNLNVIKSGTDINFVGGIRLGDSESWEANFFLDKSKQAEIGRDPITNKAQYGLGEDTEDVFGFKAIRHYNKRVALILEAADKSSSGGSYSLGFRYKL